jgi:hypothetical protein
LRRSGEAGLNLDAAFDDWVDCELELELGLIWVREFSVDNLSVELWSADDGERIANPNTEPPGNWSPTEWRERGGEASGWLESTNFVINWFNDYWADWRGKIHSS